MKIKILTLIAMGIFLGGCLPSGDDELRQWVAEQRANTKPRVVPLTEPKKFDPAPYAVNEYIEPFNSAKLTQALRRDSDKVTTNAALIAPEMARRKEPLEMFPLDAMAMVGSLSKKDGPTALLKVDNLVYQVKVGNYLGQNYGKITQITENSIRLREIVQDATGDWMERTSSLDLQEVKK